MILQIVAMQNVSEWPESFPRLKQNKVGHAVIIRQDNANSVHVVAHDLLDFRGRRSFASEWIQFVIGASKKWIISLQNKVKFDSSSHLHDEEVVIPTKIPFVKERVLLVLVEEIEGHRVSLGVERIEVTTDGDFARVCVLSHRAAKEK